MARLLNSHQSRASLLMMAPLLLLVSSFMPSLVYASGLLEIPELLPPPEQSARQEVVVTGQVTNVQLATNRQGQPAYGFLLKDTSGTVKVIGPGQVEVKGGGQGIVAGIF